MINIRPTSKGALPALRRLPSLILGLILDIVLPLQLVLYISDVFAVTVVTDNPVKTAIAGVECDGLLEKQGEPYYPGFMSSVSSIVSFFIKQLRHMGLDP